MRNNVKLTTTDQTRQLNFDLAISNILPSSSAREILEFGVYKGKSMRYIKNKASNKDSGYVFRGFDSFIGLPHDWLDQQGNLVGKGKKGRFTTTGKIPEIKGVTFYKGFFENTMDNFLEEKPDKIALLHMDADLYSSTKFVLEKVSHLIIPGTVIVFDEWIYNHNKKYGDHEARAFLELPVLMVVVLVMSRTVLICCLI
jgi:hypothetical protein